MKRIKPIQKILSILICLSVFFMYVPTGLAETGTSLPDNPTAYAASDYAKYAARMAVGSEHIAVIKADGTVEAWGGNTKEQCNVPGGLTDVKAVAAGNYNTLALKNDGTVVAWGSSYKPSVGKPEFESASSIPDEVKAVQKNIKLIAAGGATLAVVTDTNQVIVWGKQQATLQANQPGGFGNIVAIAVNSSDVAVLEDNGNIITWGMNSEIYPKPQELDSNTLALSAGCNHFMALKQDGTVAVWGEHAEDCNGISTQTGVRAIAGGWQSAGALLADGSVMGWGRTPVGFNKNGTQQIVADENIKAFSVAIESDNAGTICAMRDDGTIIVKTAIVDDLQTQIPDGLNLLTETSSSNVYLDNLVVDGYTLSPAFEATTTDYTVNVPDEVYSVDIIATVPDDIIANLKINEVPVTSGEAHTVDNLKTGNNIVQVEVISKDGPATTKIYNIIINRAGDGSLSQPAEDYAASDYARYGARIAGGNQHAAAVLEEGTVEMWGSNEKGQLEVSPEATGVKALAAGSNHTLALKNNGTVVAWGENNDGQCDIPVQLNGKKVKAVAAYNRISSALREDNQIYVWGQNIEGIKELESTRKLVNIALNKKHLLALAADGTVEAWEWDNKNKEYNSFSPEQMPSNFSGDVLAIRAGYQHALALKKDGRVVSLDNTDYPVSTELTNVGAIAAGRDYSAALCQDGMVKVWGKAGYNDKNGLLVVPSDLGNVKALAAGDYNMYALQEDGTIVSWGRNQSGEGDVPEDLNLFSEVSTNDRLVSLTVETGDGIGSFIYPVFSCEQTEGIADIPYDAGEVQITAQPYSSAAILKVNGKTINTGDPVVINSSNLKVGNNIFEIKVTAASGSQRSYTLYVKRVSSNYALPQSPEAYQESEYAAYARRMGTSSEYGLAAKKGGTVVAWGQGSKDSINLPPGLDKVVAVAAGSNHSLALKDDGTVVAWGNNDSGQCDVPNNLTEVVDISAGHEFSAALDKNGDVYVWGNNTQRQCAVPDDLSPVVDIQCGNNHILALRTDGTVKAWGGNKDGQCKVPTDLDHVVAIAAGNRHSVALKNDGTMFIWGAEGTNNEIGNLSLQYVKGIAAGKDYIAALKWDGSLAVWGSYNNLMLGVPVVMDEEILAISGSGSISYLLALNKEGILKVWGQEDKAIADVPFGLNLFADDIPYSGEAPNIPQNPVDYDASDYVQARGKICYTEYGMVILNMDGTVKYIPRVSSTDDILKEVPEGLIKVTAIATSPRNVMALQEDGTVAVWGFNEDQQCEVPETVQDITAIAATRDFNTCCLALKNDGTVLAWGNNDYGQCEVPEGLTDVTAIAAGYNHYLALRADGTVAAWGDNQCGQCDVPENLNDVARIFAGYHFSLALKNDGTVIAWGSNNAQRLPYYCGQCDVPEGLSKVVDIWISGCTCIALKSNGTVVVWGDNDLGRRNVPVGLHDVVAVSSANGITAIKKDGMVVNWGYNPGFSDQLAGLNKVLTTADDTIIFRDGTLKYCSAVPDTNDVINERLAGLNVLSGHYFAINNAQLLDSEDQSITSVANQAGYRIKARVANNYGSSTTGLTIIQVRAGEGATHTGGGRVLGCVGIFSDIPVTGSTISSDFTMPMGISGKAFVDVFVWSDWKNMVPRASAYQNLSFTVSD